MTCARGLLVLLSPWLFGACDGTLRPAMPEVGSGLPANDAGDGPRCSPPSGMLDAAADLAAPSPDATEGIDLAEDVRTRSDASRTILQAALPASVAPPRRLLPGDVRLIGSGTSSCSHQDRASGNGDRWCAFKRAAPGSSATELWVVNVSASIRGDIPRCDGTSADCLRLSAMLWTDTPIAGPTQAEANRFDGDTLLFHEPGTSKDEERFRGPIRAWRPGWPAARTLTETGLICYGDIALPLAFCLGNVDASSVLEFDLLAGPIPDPAGPPLVKVDRARVQRADFQPAFGASFSTDGSLFIYSTTATPDARVAGLRVVKTAELGSVPAREILADVMYWQLANDEQRIYYLGGLTADTKEGALMMADFPSGANPRQLARRTGRYVVLDDGTERDRGVGYFVVNPGRLLSEYRVIPNRDDLTSARTVFRWGNQLEDFHLSRNQQYTGYAKFDDKQGFNGYLARNDGSGECILNAELGRPAFEPHFLDDAKLVFWVEESDDATTVQDAWFADPDGCHGKQRFAAAIGFFVPIRNDGLIFGDDYDGDTVTLRYAKIEGGSTWPRTGSVKVWEQVDLPIVRIGPRVDHLLFQVSQGSDEDRGVYVFAVPFAPEQPDAGVSADADAAP